MLDEPVVEPVALAANLRDLTRLNRLPGGAPASISGLAVLARDASELSILDVGSGAGDMPIAFTRHGRRVRARWRVTAIDNREDVVQHAFSAISADDRVSVTLGDARRLPSDDGEFDVAHSSLLLHHLDPEDAVTALREMARVARLGVVVNDLRRGLPAYLLGAATVLALGRSPMTRHDGLISLRRAYTLRELDEMLDAAGLEVVWRSNPWMPRVVTAAVARTSR